MEAFVLELQPDGRLATPVLAAPSARHLSDLLATGHRDRASGILASLHGDGGLYDVEVGFDLSHGPVACRCVGAGGEGALLLAVADNAGAAMAALERATLGRSDGDMLLRHAVRAQARALDDAAQAADSTMQMLWRVNSELAGLHRDLVRANRELQALQDERTRILGMVAHDLRSPVQVARLAVDLLGDGSATVEQRREITERAGHSLGYMLELIDDLLDLAVIEAGSITLERKPTDLDTLVFRVRDILDLKSRREGASVVAWVPEGTWRVHLDEHRIEQVLINLVDNAVRVSPPESPVKISLRRRKRSVHVVVSDRGPGIPEEIRSDLFQPYRQGDGAGKAGLGLAICRRIIEEHGGQIRVRHRRGGGTAFTFSLPAEPQVEGSSQGVQGDRRRSVG